MKCSVILLEVKVHLVQLRMQQLNFSIWIKINYMCGNNTMSYARPNTGKLLIFIMSKLCC